MTQALTTETIKLWRINAEITLGETDELDPENNAAKAILALTEELLANREAQPLGYIDPANLKTYRGVMAGGSWSPVQRTLSGLNLTLPIYLAAPPAPAVVNGRTAEGWMTEALLQKKIADGLRKSAPAVLDGYCVMPLTLTAENGAKGALSGEFKVSRTVICHECGGEGCDDCADAGEFEEEITVPWDTIKDIYRAAVDACRAAMLAQPVSQGYKLVPVEPTEEMIAAAMNCDDVEFNSDETFCVNFDNIYRAMLAAAPEGGN